ncbi:MAG TPA: hypothetical protein VFM34_05145 [Moraxellaceae bacterium]|nr:hypothetical protein [Moraxellaceae bacterium]
MGYFDDLVPQQSESATSGGFFDDLMPTAEKPQAPTSRPMPSSPAGLPDTWDLELGGQKWRSALTKLPDGRTVYTLPLEDGRTGIVQRRKDTGELMLKPYEPPKGSNGLVRDVKDAVQGQLQGITDVVVNAPARLVDIAVNAPARLIDKGLKAAGVDTSGTPSLDQMAADKLGLAPSLDQALANQNEGFRQSTGDSQAGRIGRIGGNITATIPMGNLRATEGTGAMANLANGLLQGGAGGAAVAAGRGDQDIATETGAGAVAGGVLNTILPPVVRVAASAINAARPAAGASGQVIPAAGDAIEAASDDVIKQAKIAAANADLQWDSLDSRLQARIIKEVQQAAAIGADVPKGAVVRKAVYESQGLTPTRALVTRDWADAWREQNLLTEPEGAPLRQIYERNNSVVRQNIDDLIPRGLQPVETPAYGTVLRDSLTANEREAAKGVSAAYTAAREAEGAKLADVTDLANFISQNKSRLLASGDQGKFVIGYLEDMDKLGENGLGQALKSGKASATDVKVRLDELTDLRAMVNDAWSSAQDKNAKAVLNQMRQMLNKAEWQAGGELFKQARQLRQAKGNAFENNPLIDRLLSKQKGYNADLIEDSQVFDRAIVKSSPEQFKALWMRVDSQARNQTQAQLADHIKSTVFSNQGRNEAGEVVASAAKLDKVLRDIGPQKLRLVFGEQRAKDLQMLAKSLGEISNPPKGTVPQGSAPKLSFLSRAIMGALSFGGKVPMGGEMLAGGAEVIRRGGAVKANQAAVKDALDFYAPYTREAMGQIGQRGALFAAPAGAAGGLLVDRVPKRPK